MQNVKEMYGSVTVVLAGELDHCTASQIRRQLDEILEDPGVRHLCLPQFFCNRRSFSGNIHLF